MPTSLTGTATLDTVTSPNPAEPVRAGAGLGSPVVLAGANANGGVSYTALAAGVRVRAHDLRTGATLTIASDKPPFLRFAPSTPAELLAGMREAFGGPFILAGNFDANRAEHLRMDNFSMARLENNRFIYNDRYGAVGCRNGRS